MKAVILAGGKGTRLKPFTYILPKPLVPVGEKPVLAILLEGLKKAGIKDVIFCVSHMAELIMAYFGNGEKFNINIEYSMEEKPLGTIAPLKLLKNLPENFLVMNGDLYTDLNFKEIYDHHIKQNCLITVGATQRKVKIDFGVLGVEKHRLKSFTEKPEYCHDVSMGIYVFNRKVLEMVPEETHYGFDDLVLDLLDRKESINIYNYKGFWLDLGRIEDFDRANLLEVSKKLQ